MKQFFFYTGIILVLFSCSGDEMPSGPVVQPDGGVYGKIYTGGEYHLGPVDWEETKWPNAFAPYPPKIRQIEGRYLAGLENSHTANGELCDCCVKITTEKGKSLILRVVTRGVTTKNSIDVSPEAYQLLNSGEYPRYMSWHVTKCPPNGENIYYQFREKIHPYWVSFWVRNIALPLKSVEVKNAKYKDWHKLQREGWGVYTDYGGFGSDGPFQLRITAIDGQVIVDSFDKLEAGALVRSSGQF